MSKCPSELATRLSQANSAGTALVHSVSIVHPACLSPFIWQPICFAVHRGRYMTQAVPITASPPPGCRGRYMTQSRPIWPLAWYLTIWNQWAKHPLIFRIMEISEWSKNTEICRNKTWVMEKEWRKTVCLWESQPWLYVQIQSSLITALSLFPEL